MKGWAIFKHSVRMVLRNLNYAVRIATGPVLIGVAVVFALLASAGLPMTLMGDQQALSQALAAGSFGLTLLAVFLTIVAVQIWVFVSWHRFVLLEEYPSGLLPAFRGDRMLAYVGNALLIFLVALAVMIPAGVIAALVGGIAGEGGAAVIALVIILFALFTAVAIYRLTPILPAAAIGQPLKLRDAWDKTRGTTGTIMLLVVLLGLFNVLLQVVVDLSMAVFAPLGIVFLILATLVATLVNVSVVTTFYGHYVEGRPI
ncbi:hypothetical protein KUV26_12050 [Leisingera daeponensis]|uniref:Glycerophosphoryl diester phosphodiesterase membrane domain-containing protein n=1 Tax=Leisingera daeponensis TaxID=405746 RepID=A0ABS7NGX5_9RHOB|nr:hypothetical protein [Leisingera daeponensis]MBY6140171.1 hypothetical protein [Leisingera daeponensis]